MFTNTGAVGRRALLGAGLGLGASAILAGCSNEGRGGTTPSNGTSSPVGSSLLPTYVRYEGVKADLSGSEFNIPDGFLRYPEKPVRATDKPPGDGQPIETMGFTNTPVPPAVDRNAYWQKLNEVVGSPVTISLTPTGNDYNQKFATSIAGKRLGQIFVIGSAPQLPQVLASTALDLTPHLSGDAVKKYPFLANLPTAAWKSAVYDGKLYGIPIPRGAISTQVLYARANILDEKGLTGEVKNLADFVTLCTELTDPAKNTWALTSAPTNWIRMMYGVPNGWSENNGQLTSANEHPANQDALATLVDLWKKQLIHPDAFTGQNRDLKVRFGNGTCPLSIDTFSAWQNTLRSIVGDEKDLKIIAVPSHDGSGPGRAWMGGPSHNVTAINKSQESRVETLLSYLNFLATPFGTEEYLFRKYGEPGVHHTMKDGNPVLNEKGASEVEMGLIYQADAPWPIYVPEVDGATQAQFDAQKATIPTAVENPAAGLYSETSAQKGGAITKRIDQVAVDIIQGRIPVAAWADEVKKWKADGGDKIRDELSQALATTR